MQVPGRQTWERGRIGFLSPPLGVLQCRAGSLPGGCPSHSHLTKLSLKWAGAASDRTQTAFLTCLSAGWSSVSFGTVGSPTVCWSHAFRHRLHWVPGTLVRCSYFILILHWWETLGRRPFKWREPEQCS